MNTIQNNTETFHTDEQHKLHLQVWVKDKVTGEIIGRKWMRRGAIAKAFLPTSNTPIVGSLRGLFVIEI